MKFVANKTFSTIYWFGFLWLLLQKSETVVANKTVGCIDSTDEIAWQESLVSDFSIKREYILCEDTVYAIGFWDSLSNDAPLYGGSAMISLRPNLHIRCGATGSRNNRCLLEAGDVHIDGTTSFDGVNTSITAFPNVVISGLTFVNASKHVAWIDKPGSITFRDCEFRDNTQSISPVLLDYYNPSSPKELKVTFQRCSFVQNSFYGVPAQPALIVGNGEQNRLTIHGCLFSDNDMVSNNYAIAYRNSFLIETSGPLEMIQNCFSNNKVKVSPVAVYKAPFIASNNYQSDYAADRVCQFASSFETNDAYEYFTPTCYMFDSLTCEAATNSTWIESEPPIAATDYPTFSPTAFPTSFSNFTTSGPTQSTEEPTSVWNDSTFAPSVLPSFSNHAPESSIATTPTGPPIPASAPPTNATIRLRALSTKQVIIAHTDTMSQEEPDKFQLD